MRTAYMKEGHEQNAGKGEAPASPTSGNTVYVEVVPRARYCGATPWYMYFTTE